MPEYLDVRDFETHVTEYRNVKFSSTAATTFMTILGDIEEIIDPVNVFANSFIK